MKHQSKLFAILITAVALATRALAGPPPQAQEESYKRVMASIAKQKALKKLTPPPSGGR